ncbi:DUF6584 family protein [Micromonospora sp. KC721]|uniref:DUF6584 family protein n=1 Tax=Micromonospora sp. KC721 TaxID=2530380 RepID=UPI00104D45E4|nr:DUF6584 family protein [Micromonospora sp. KC721]TDB70092.1 hypothetical protein E1182_28135 [Micromonospora sp. KC721]
MRTPSEQRPPRPLIGKAREQLILFKEIVPPELHLGHYRPAMQRLASLTAAYPDDLDLRARRAALHRQVGNLVDVGRWGFLTVDATPDEIAAFDKAHSGAWARLLASKVKAGPADQLGPVASARLAQLIQQAGQEAQPWWPGV